MQKIKVFYTDKQVADQGNQNLVGMIKSPSALKPRVIAEVLRSLDYVEFVEPNPVSIEDLKLAHDPKYVDDVINLNRDNGFGTRSKELNDSLLYTNGAMLDATLAATIDGPTCALVSGFHHAGYNGWEKLGYFCTFNGLIITAKKLLEEHDIHSSIIDCDMHWGNGTDDILDRIHVPIKHFTFGKYYKKNDNAQAYLNELRLGGFIHGFLSIIRPQRIIYQAGADVHINDPYGGILTTDEIYERDLRMFTMAKDLNIPITWNLAGGYQIDENGSIDKVIDIHLNTFKACREVYKKTTPLN